MFVKCPNNERPKLLYLNADLSTRVQSSSQQQLTSQESAIKSQVQYGPKVKAVLLKAGRPPVLLLLFSSVEEGLLVVVVFLLGGLVVVSSAGSVVKGLLEEDSVAFPKRDDSVFPSIVSSGWLLVSGSCCVLLVLLFKLESVDSSARLVLSGRVVSALPPSFTVVVLVVVTIGSLLTVLVVPESTFCVCPRWKSTVLLNMRSKLKAADDEIFIMCKLVNKIGPFLEISGKTKMHVGC